MRKQGTDSQGLLCTEVKRGESKREKDRPAYLMSVGVEQTAAIRFSPLVAITLQPKNLKPYEKENTP